MEVDVTNCNLMSNTAIQAVFQALPQIRDINMTLLTTLTDQAFFLNLTSCAHITDETLSRIIPAAPRLRNLALTKCDRITDVGVSAIKLLGKHLHYLHLGHCSKLTDKSIATLTQHCTRIRYLDLACCSKLTDAAVFAMAQLPKLRRIGLVKCSNITDHGLYAMLVSQIVPQTLERVHLSYCIHLSDIAVAALVSQCNKLTHLSVTGVPAFMSPKYQKFCRVPPTEFTAHQRDVFCVFSGKGVRELRQFMQENPTVPSTLSSIQRSYRLMGSTVASMVTGGGAAAAAATPGGGGAPHSSAIVAHLGLGLAAPGGAAGGGGVVAVVRETEVHVQNLAVQNAPDADGDEASSSSSSVDEEEAAIIVVSESSSIMSIGFTPSVGSTGATVGGYEQLC
ncbi:SCF ubiquitin ligase complex subunit [Modicella reniformis]|uniref:SCF ubiquitin ligase complex subunit n=1 Tax=Modicella reniformis TaxID=1440133 RepID=A0A9P6SU18_9FUNG|nr:SCF ubiquitin ligase complex subunit [Modicella reniformis]